MTNEQTPLRRALIISILGRGARLEGVSWEGSLGAVRLLEAWAAGEPVLDGKLAGSEAWEELREDLDRTAVADLRKLSLVMLVVMAGLGWAAHRSVRLVAMNLGSLAVCLLLLAVVLWVLGIPMTIVSLMSIPLLIGVVLDYTMHLLLGLEHHGGRLDRAMRHLLAPIGLTGVASVIGFTAPALGSQPALVNFGLVMDAGVFCAVGTALVLLPAFYRLGGGRGGGVHYSRTFYRAVWFEMAARLAAVVPRGWLRGAAWCGGWVYARCNPGKVRVVRENLGLLGGQPVDAAAARRVYGNFGAALADYFHMGARPREEALGMLEEMAGYEHLVAAREKGRGCLLLTPHLSLYEIGGLHLTEAGFESAVLTIPEPSPALTEWRRAYRLRWGVETMEVGQDVFSALPVLEHLRKNRFVIALVDRPLARHNVPVAYPGGILQVAGGVLRLGLAAGCAVVVATVTPGRKGGYVARVREPFWMEDRGGREATVAFYAQRAAGLMLEDLQRHREHWFQFAALGGEHANS